MNIAGFGKVHKDEDTRTVHFENLEVFCGTHQVFLDGYIGIGHTSIRISEAHNAPVKDLAVALVEMAVNEQWLLGQVLAEQQKQYDAEPTPLKQCDILTLTTEASLNGMDVNLSGEPYGFATFAEGFFRVYDACGVRLPGLYRLEQGVLIKKD